MNTKLFETVKQKCKDTGLSEKYLKAITEKLGVSVADDSTDETAINEAANLISDLAKESQGEATRWAAKKGETEKDKGGGKGKSSDDDIDDTGDGKGKEKTAVKTPDPEVVALQKRIDEFEKAKLKSDRESAIRAAQAKHKVPDWRMKGLAVPEDQDPDAFMADIRQDLIAQKLIPADSEGAKAASEKQIDEAANSLLESITPK